METDKKLGSSEAAGTRLVVPKSSSRRRLLQAGLGASPAILSIVSEPVRAFNRTAPVTCRSASAFASVAAAAHAGITTSANAAQSCLGLSPASWNTASTWPVAKNTLFSNVFSGSYTLRSNSSPTFSDILGAATPYTTAETLARNFVAAYLNSQGTSKTPLAVVTGAQLQIMWTRAVAGSYSPTAGTTAWSTNDVNNWLTQTFAG